MSDPILFGTKIESLFKVKDCKAEEFSCLIMEKTREQYIRIAQESGVFPARELRVLKEVLQECQDDPRAGYLLFDERVKNFIVGFVIFGRTPLTESSWDIYWLVVDKDHQRMGVGKRLLLRVESHLRKRGKQAILRVETSSRREYAPALALYTKQGFSEAGSIPDFYSKDDDLVILYKELKGRRYQTN